MHKSLDAISFVHLHTHLKRLNGKTEANLPNVSKAGKDEGMCRKMFRHNATNTTGMIFHEMGQNSFLTGRQVLVEKLPFLKRQNE